MTRLLRPLLLAAALLISQHAAMLHGIAHAAHEVELASSAGGKAPALDHGADVCAAFGALAHALAGTTAVQPEGDRTAQARGAPFQSFTAATRVVFDPRAPPHSA
jgi:hypothetical protein